MKYLRTVAIGDALRRKLLIAGISALQSCGGTAMAHKVPTRCYQLADTYESSARMRDSGATEDEVDARVTTSNADPSTRDAILDVVHAVYNNPDLLRMTPTQIASIARDHCSGSN